MLSRCLLLSTLSLCMCTGKPPRVEKAAEMVEVKEGVRVELGGDERTDTCEGGGCTSPAPGPASRPARAAGATTNVRPGRPANSRVGGRVQPGVRRRVQLRVDLQRRRVQPRVRGTGLLPDLLGRGLQRLNGGLLTQLTAKLQL
jgi:hypothetical protein